MGVDVTPERRTRLRLIVIQALVFSLFATLLGRLYYVQVLGGEEYQARSRSAKWWCNPSGG
jgi:penicillin-binding protein 2